MLKIEVKGVEFNNKGAEMMLLSIMQALDSHFSNYQLVLSPGYLLPYEKRAKLGAWQKFSFTFCGIDWTWLGNLAPSSLKKMLCHFGIIVEKDIDIVFDASGFVYSDHWGEHKIKQTLSHLKRISKSGQKYIFLPQAFGPFTDNNAYLMQEIMTQSKLIIAREQKSYDFLKAFEQSKKVECFPDFTPLLTVENTLQPKDLPQEYVSIIPNYKMFSKKSKVEKNCYIQFLINVVSIVETFGLIPILLNHEGKEDYDICLAVNAACIKDIKILNKMNALQVKKVIAHSTFCVSSRFHGCVSSLSQGVPSLATSWSHKYEALYQLYQCENLILDINISYAQLSVHIENMILNRDLQASKLLELSQVHKNQCKAMWQLIFDKI